MQELSLYQLFTERLNSKKIPYAVTGSVASIIYGQPRMTHDIDIVINLNTNRVRRAFRIIPNKRILLSSSRNFKDRNAKNRKRTLQHYSQ